MSFRHTSVREDAWAGDENIGLIYESKIRFLLDDSVNVREYSGGTREKGSS
jgi:hypothetical protein